MIKGGLNTSEARIALAKAYFLASDCLDPELTSSQELARFYVGEAVEILRRTPVPQANTSDLAGLLAKFEQRLGDLPPKTTQPEE